MPAVRGCCLQTVRPRRHISQVASGFLDQDRHAFLLLAVLLGELRKLHFQNPQHPWPWVVLRHLRTSVVFFPNVGVVEEGDTQHPPKQSCSRIAISAPVPFSSFIKTFWVAPLQFHHVLGPVRENCCLPFCHYDVRLPAGGACPTSLFLFSSVLRCMKEVSPGRHVLQDSVVFLYVASVVRPSLVACAKTFAEGVPLFHVQQPQTAPRAPACHQHLQIWLLHTSQTLGFPHSPVLFLTNPTEGDLSLTLSHWPLSSKSRERSLFTVSYLASWIIVVCSFDATCSLSHNANLRAPSRTLRTWRMS